MQITDWEDKIFHASYYNFNKIALNLFRFQYENNPLYKQFSDSIGTDPAEVNSITEIPFLPIQFFKTHEVITTTFHPEVIFESSGTGDTKRSRHLVKSIDLYKKSFARAFELFYGKPNEWCILALLPSYLEKENSSLVMMADELIKTSQHPFSDFYLYDLEKLHQTLLHNEILQQPTLLIGVSYALLDLAEKYTMKLSNTIIMETGGMKGRRKEITRKNMHEILQKRLGAAVIHSEYGMTELLSQAYSRESGLFKCAPWMKVLIRDEDDPLLVTLPLNNRMDKTGVINVIDLANIFSCAFIATDDIGKLHGNDYFEILGRSDSSEVRGCSLLSLDQFKN